MRKAHDTHTEGCYNIRVSGSQTLALTGFPEGFIKPQVTGPPTSRVSDSAGLRICLSNQLPGEAVAVDPGIPGLCSRLYT